MRQEKARQFAKLSVNGIGLRDFTIACHRSKRLCCRFLFLSAYSIYLLQNKFNIQSYRIYITSGNFIKEGKNSLRKILFLSGIL
ncbi:MAG TPA: hypothetical protein DCW73_06390 [Treponema sp.]|nr:hypothetical protein [Treponema sp.]